MTHWHCLTDIELDQLYHGAGRREALGHVFICPACRGRLLIMEESMSEHQSFEFAEEFALAAKGAKVLPVRSLSSADESLICRLERESGQNEIAITVLADKHQWGEFVVIWPGTGEPFFVPVGEKKYTQAGSLGAINLWQISAAEASWKGKAENIPDEISGKSNSVLIQKKEKSLRVELSNPSLLTEVILQEKARRRILTIPSEISITGEMSIYLFTPLTGVELK